MECVSATRRGTIWALALVLLGVAATAGSAQELTGKGEWHSVSSDLLGGTWTAALTRSGGGVIGTLTLSGSNMFSGGQVSGSIDASSIVFGVVAEGAQATTFSAKLDGDSIKGEWECGDVNDHGVWYGSLKASKAQ